MITTAVKHETQWVTASPIWGTASADPLLMQRPALLRFNSDNFMQDAAQLLETDPEQLNEFVAEPESFQARPVGKPKDWKPKPPPLLKLYQPAHGHFYLVAGTLVCRLPGLPDRAVNTAAGEKVSFLLRRVAPDGREMAWVSGTDPTKPKKWQMLSPDSSGEHKSVAPSEELLPMFPMNFTENGRPRRLFVGLIPTSSRESFQVPTTITLIDDPKKKQLADTRMDEVESRVLERLDELTRLDSSRRRRAATDDENEGYLFLLLDLAEFLATNAPDTWQFIHNGVRAPSTHPGSRLFDALFSKNVEGVGSPTWGAALRSTWDQRDRITGEAEPPSSLKFDLKKSNLGVNDLRESLRLAIGPLESTKVEQAPVLMPKVDPTIEASYIVRCLYQRPSCLFEPDVVSSASERFTFATFFDPDAPSRPVRITLPIDTSIAGLRKFPKNVAFLTSDKLRKQMAGVADLKKALDGDLGPSPDFQLGEICSFSIPIITLCAFIVLFIFLILLNIAFFWLPFLKVCLPIPLRAKK